MVWIFGTRLNPDNPLGGAAHLRGRWRALCGVCAPLLRAHRPSYGLVAGAQIHSQIASPSSRVLMDYLGYMRLILFDSFRLWFDRLTTYGINQGFIETCRFLALTRWACHPQQLIC
jgi:hypothetical protein